jgi:hypothetical protein
MIKDIKQNQKVWFNFYFLTWQIVSGKFLFVDEKGKYAVSTECVDWGSLRIPPEDIFSSKEEARVALVKRELDKIKISQEKIRLCQLPTTKVAGLLRIG